MINFIDNKQLKLLIYVILTLVLFNFFSIVNPYHITNKISDFKSQHSLVQQYELSEIINIKQIVRYKINFDIPYRIIAVLGLIFLFTYHLIQKHKHAIYAYLHSSRLFLRLQRLLLPMQNTSKYKTSLILTIDVF